MREDRVLNIDGCKIKISTDFLPNTDEGLRRNLNRFYDVANQIASNLEKRGISTSSMFYTDAEIEELKKSTNYNFL